MMFINYLEILKKHKKLVDDILILPDDFVLFGDDTNCFSCSHGLTFSLLESMIF